MLLETDCIKFPTKSNTQIMVILNFYFNKHLNTQKDSTCAGIKFSQKQKLQISSTYYTIISLILW